MWEQWDWCVGGLLRMDNQSFLLPVWCGDLDGVGSVGERELGERLVRAVPDGQGTFMVAGWATSHS